MILRNAILPTTVVIEWMNIVQGQSRRDRMAPRSDPLPGEKRAYFLAAGEGERYVFGTQPATIIAPARSTGSLFELVVLSGGKGDVFPPHLHARAHESIFVIDGRLELTLNGQTCLLTPGDYACIPAGTPHGYRMRSHRTRLLSFTVGDEVARLYSMIGESFAGFEPPEKALRTDFATPFAAAESGADFKLVTHAPDGDTCQLVEGG